jgi:hypothetical protein
MSATILHGHGGKSAVGVILASQYASLMIFNFNLIFKVQILNC